MSQLNDLFEKNQDFDIQKKIVEELLNEEHLETKTELRKPLRWSCMNIVQKFIDNHKLPTSAQILGDFLDISFRYLISNERKGRGEYIEALKSLNSGGFESQFTSRNNFSMLPKN